MEATYLSINRDKDGVCMYVCVCVCVCVCVYTYNGILLGHKNEFESVLVRWINLEPVIQSEASQKEKNK